MIAIAAAVLLANLPYLLGIFDPNPLGTNSGLASSVLRGPIGGSPTIDPSNGFYSQALGHRAVLDLFGLHIPWWNPYEGTGVPLAGELEAAPFFPASWFTAFSNGQIYERILLELVAGWATYKLVRRLGVVRLAGIAAGVAFALNGTFAWLSHAVVNPVPSLPLLLLGIESAYSAAAEGRRGGWWLIAVAGALSFYGGFPETTYVCVLMAVVWFGWRTACLSRGAGGETRFAVRSLLLKSAAGAAVAALISAPVLIALLDYTSHAYLGHHSTGLLGRRHLPDTALPQLLMPYVYGPIFGYVGPGFALTGIWGSVGGYLGTSLLLFAGLGLVSRGRTGLRLILLAWIVLVMARIYGLAGLGAVLGVLPGMSRVAFFRYSTPTLELSVVVLVALGIDDLRRRPTRAAQLTVMALALAAVAGAAVGAHWLASRLGPHFNSRPYYPGSIVWGAMVVAGAVVVALLRDRRWRVGLATLLIAADALVLFAIPEGAAPRAVHLDLAPVAFLQRNLGASRAFTLGPLAPNYGTYFGVSLLDVNDVPLPADLERYIHTRLDPYADPDAFVGRLVRRSLLAPSPAQELVRNVTAYRAAAVKYVLTPSGQSLPAPSFRLVFRSPSAWIYALSGSLAYFTSSGCAVRTWSRTDAAVACQAPTELVRRETYMPGWSASIDGRPAPVRMVDGLFQAVSVPAGRHRVTFGFIPPHMIWGGLALAAGLVWLILGAVLARRPAAPRAASG